MKTTITTAIAGTLTAALAMTAFAQKPADTTPTLQEITVSASRLNAKPMVSTVGWPRAAVRQITLSYGVNIEGIDLGSTAAVADLERVIGDTALDVCKEIGRQYPGSTPNDAACAKDATAKATARLHELVTAWNKKASR